MAGRKMSFSSLKRVLKLLYSFYPALLPLTIFCILFASVTAAAPAVFQQQVLAVIEKWFLSRDWNSAKAEIIPKIIALASL